MAEPKIDVDAWLASKTASVGLDQNAIDAWLAAKAAQSQPQASPEVLEDPFARAAQRLRGAKSERKASGSDSTIRAIEDRAEAAGFGAGNAATFGMMNRGFGLADDIRTGSPWGTGTDKMAAHEAELQKQYPGYHLAGSVLGGVGTGVGLARSGVGFSREGANLLQRIGMGALEGGAFGAVSGAGQTYSGLSDPWKYAQNAIIGGGFGVGGGAIGEGIGAGAAAGWNKLRDFRSNAFPEPVIRGARADVEGLENLHQLGPDAMLVDAGPSMQSTAQAAALGIGPNRTAIVQALTERDAGTIPRLQAAANEALGPAPRPSVVREELDANRVRINAEEYTPRLANQAIPPRVGNEMMTVLDNMERQYRIDLGQVRDRLTRPGIGHNSANQPDLDPQSWLNARHHIDDMVTRAEGQGQRHQAEVLSQLRREVDRRLAASVPGIKEADAIYGANARAGEAFETGRRVLKSDIAEPIHPDDLRDLMRTNAVPVGAAPPGPPSANVRLRQGVRSDIDQRLGNATNDLLELERTLKTPYDWNNMKLRDVFPTENVDRLTNAVTANRKFREGYQRIVQGSDTAQRQAAEKTADLATMPVPTRNIAGTVEQVGRWGLGAAIEARKQAQREAIARLMATRDPAEVARLRAELLAHIRAGAPSAARAAQRGRGTLQGLGMSAGPIFEDYLQ